ncbi:MAG: hypothetical protein QM796_21555 [Chthoniobacteraceae bacterium]
MVRNSKKQPRVKYRKLGRHRAWGLYHWTNELIELDPRMKPKLALDTLIHESLHHLFPDLPESTIEKKATQLTAILWREDYRRVAQ